MWVRSLPVIAALAAGLPAAADPLERCNGKYADVVDMIERGVGKYETLYSGGNHWQRLDDVGGTLDLYRLWRGYPDVKLRSTFQPPGWRDPEFSSEEINTYNNTATDLWTKGSWALHAGGPAKPTRAEAFWAGFGLDILTSPGPAPDWWRHLNAQDHLTDMQRWVAEKAKTEPGLDWLQMALAASAAPWANSWRALDDTDEKTRQTYERLAQSAFDRYRAGDGIEWLVVAALNSPQVNRNRPLADELGKLREQAKSCDATPAQYAAYAVVLPILERDIPELQEEFPKVEPLYADMPATIRYTTVSNRLSSYVLDTIARGEKADHLYLFQGDALQGIDRLRISVDLAQLYTATRIEDVPTSSSAYVRRAYNMLSADHLTMLARRKDADPELMRVAFARHVALGHVQKAAALVSQLKIASPKDAAKIDRIWSEPWPEATRLAMIVFETPNLSTLLKGGEDLGDVGFYYYWDYVRDRRNLPEEYASGAFLQRDFETFLILPQRYGAYWGMRGSTIEWIERSARRNRYDFWRQQAPAPRVIADGPSSRSFPFIRLIAWSEVGRLTGEEKLMAVVAPEIIAWAEEQSKAPSKREETAATLAKLIMLCRTNDCGDYAGKPTSLRAFQILKRRLPETKAARKTRWWFNSPL